ncbi:MAG TPA: CoA pyrophosphatase, partial [Pseudomonadales bacterium]|nr:CoA pyrophosphatase [Pseudomonadales bacterium]
HRNIRFAGHICFPGGRVDPSDESAIATALRESEEEIALDPAEVDVLGALGDYYTQAGYRITPVVGLVSTNVTLSANPSEVEAIYRISLADMLRSQSYRLRHRTPTRGHYSYEEKDIRIAGPTVSLMIGLYESLLAFQASTISAK